MKKKNVLYVLAVSTAILCVLLSGCGSKKETSPAGESEPAAVSAEESAVSGEEVSVSAEAPAAETAESATAGTEAPAAEAAVSASAGGKVILDEEAVKVVLTRFGAFTPDPEDTGTTKTADPEVEAVFEVTNNGDEEIVVDLRDPKVGETGVRRLLLNGDVVAPGATMTFRYGIIAKENAAEGGQTEETVPAVTWDMVSQQGLTGTIHVMTIQEEIAQAAFSTAE